MIKVEFAPNVRLIVYSCLEGMMEKNLINVIQDTGYAYNMMHGFMGSFGLWRSCTKDFAYQLQEGDGQFGFVCAQLNQESNIASIYSCW